MDSDDESPSELNDDDDEWDDLEAEQAAVYFFWEGLVVLDVYWMFFWLL